ncbi:MAG: phosphatidylglycerol lysyltransferase domain-containing protein [Acidimicrobiales bacterium]
MLTRYVMVVKSATASAPAVEWARDCRDELLDVLGAHGAEAGAYSVLGPDPWRVVWNARRTGFASFIEADRCVVVWRSPVSPDGVAEPLAGALAYARSRHKALFAVPVNDATRDAGVELGLRAVWIGTECYLDLPTWSTAGGRRQKVRWARSHALKLGYRWREASPLASARDRVAIERVENHWKSERAERRTDSFLRTDFLELADLRRYFVCEGDEGVVASLACTPVSARAWYLQDPVRHPDAPRGALEGAIALALDTFRDEGYDFASNGPLAFWRPDGTTEISHPLGPLVDYVMNFFDNRYHLNNINRFRSKFEADTTAPLYALRSQRLITPGVARSLTRLLTAPATR